MNTLITGNAGFIGGYLTRRLVSLGHSVTGLDINPDNPQREICNCITGDICDREIVMKALKSDRIDVIINLAAKHHDFGISEDEFFDTNEKGTKNLTECASTLNIGKFIFFSTVAVYGNQPIPTTEKLAPHPVSLYSRSKLAAEKVLECWVEDNPGREVLIIRPTVVFGPDNYANVYHLIKKIKQRRFLFVGNGDNIKSIAYVENLVEATVFLLNRLNPGVEYFNYSDEPQMTIKQIVDIISLYAGVKIPKIRFPLPLILLAVSPFDILEKITGCIFPITAKRIKKFNTATHHKADKIREMGFKQPFSLEEGFRRTLEWFAKTH